jgi:hypothetical protein
MCKSPFHKPCQIYFKLSSGDPDIPDFSVGNPNLDVLGLPDPEPLVSGTDPDPSFSHKGFEQTKIMLAKSGVGSGFVSQRYRSPPDPDPHQNVTDPQHWQI